MEGRDVNVELRECEREERRRQEIATIGEDVGRKKSELSHIAGGDVKWYNYGGRQ